MNYNLFIDKYQPLYFKDFELEQTIVDILRSFVKYDNVNIMFIGSFGSGKTTLLNSILREYYLNYDNYENNVLRINNIKEHGINYYRNDVKTFCQTFSTIKNKKKTIVIDDIDTINEQSQQIFRNCIDKYSSNTNFICSCVNSQKVIESLKTRLYVIRIKPISKETIKKIMVKIKNNENIFIENQETEDFILNICNNNVKTMINYMEKFKILNAKITLEVVKNICSNISFFTIETFIKLIKEKKLTESIQLLYSIYDKGYSTIDILDNLFNYVKMTETINDEEKYIFIKYICKYIAIFYNINEDIIELTLFTNEIINSIHNNDT